MYQILRHERHGGLVMKQNSQVFEHRGEEVSMEYLTFPLLEQTGMVEHLFTTRMGGVSKGIYSSMNLSFTRGDEDFCVLQNYERVARVLRCDIEDMVASHQTHTTNIRRVTGADRGKGIVCPRDYEEIDGLITNEKGIALACFYADCVPLYFVDTEHEAIGLAHSGWRGTIQKMGACMVEQMQEQFGSSPEKLIAAIGPSICQECYEVSEEVATAFQELFTTRQAKSIMDEIHRNGCYDDKNGIRRQVIKPGRMEGKYQLDLWLANIIILRMAGIPLEQIQITDICTCHNPEYLFSHRASEGKRGNLGAFLMLKKNEC